MEVKLNVKMIRGWVELNTSIQTCRPQLRTCGGVAFLIEIFNTQHQDTKEKTIKPLPEAQRTQFVNLVIFFS